MADVTINQLTSQAPGTNDVFPFSTAVSPSTYKASLAQIKTAMSIAWSDVSGKPSFATVATTGSYTDLINKPTIPAAPASQQLVRAWVNFDGTGVVGQNQTIRSSYNVSSVYKNAIGDYTINFAVGTFADANYCIMCSTSTPNQNLMNNISDNNGSGHAKEIFQSGGVAQRSASSCRVGNYTNNETYKYNPQAFGVVVYR